MSSGLNQNERLRELIKMLVMRPCSKLDIQKRFDVSGDTVARLMQDVQDLGLEILREEVPNPSGGPGRGIVVYRGDPESLAQALGLTREKGAHSDARKRGER